MPAHPTLPESDAHQIVSWILSLAGDTNVQKSLPLAGTITPPRDLEPNTSLVLSATYTDKGGNNIKALTASNSLVLPGSNLTFTGKEKTEGFTHARFSNMNILVLPDNQGWFALDSIDLTGVRSVNIMAGWQQAPSDPMEFEVRLDAPAGKLLGKGRMSVPKKDQKSGIVQVNLSSVNDGKFHKLYFIHMPGKSERENPAGMSAVKFSAR